MKLKRLSGGEYVTPDGRYKVEKNAAYTACVGPHPSPISRGVRELLQKQIAANGLASTLRSSLYPKEVVWAVVNDRGGYMCPGGADHDYVSWGVWDVDADDYIVGGEHFDSKAAAVEFLEQHLGVRG